VSKEALPCFRCGETLTNVIDTQENQPCGGTEFRTHGHYGSTFWDSFNGTELVLNVCDCCLRVYGDRLATQGPPRKVEYAPMVPYTVYASEGARPLETIEEADQGQPDPDDHARDS
jgi:hypothetical protein